MLKDRKKPTEHRQGTLVQLLDLFQEISEFKHNNNLFDVEGDKYNTKEVEKLLCLINELRMFDIIQYGNLYLTSGGRIVLDKGYGECFNDSDKVIYTLDELTRGTPAKQFLKKISKYVENVD